VRKGYKLERLSDVQHSDTLTNITMIVTIEQEIQEADLN